MFLLLWFAHRVPVNFLSRPCVFQGPCVHRWACQTNCPDPVPVKLHVCTQGACQTFCRGPVSFKRHVCTGGVGRQTFCRGPVCFKVHMCTGEPAKLSVPSAQGGPVKLSAAALCVSRSICAHRGPVNLSVAALCLSRSTCAHRRPSGHPRPLKVQDRRVLPVALSQNGSGYIYIYGFYYCITRTPSPKTKMPSIPPAPRGRRSGWQFGLPATVQVSQ